MKAKKVLATILAMVLTASVISGCGGAGSAGESGDSTNKAAGESSNGTVEETGGDAETVSAEETGGFDSVAGMVVDPNSDAVSSKDTLRIRIPSEPPAFDRHLNASYYSAMVNSFVCSYLMNREYDANGNYVTLLNDYSLATDYKYDDGYTGVTFTLRDGVQFANGTDMTAEDVAFSIVLFSDQAAYGFIDFDNVAAVDEKTVYIPFTRTEANALNRIADIPIYSLAYYEELDAAKDNSYFYGEGIMGTGPYRMVEYVPTDHISLEANEYYFGGVPKIKNMDIRIIKEAAVAFMELQTGGIDVLMNPDWISTNDVANGVYGDNFRALKNANNSCLYVGFNCSNNSVLGDLRLRQAICYAINLDNLLVGAVEGICEEMSGILSVFTEGESKKWSYEYNPEKAKELLAEAGYPDGVDVTLIFSGDENRKMSAEIIANQLKEVGINVTVNQGEGATITAMEANETTTWDLYVRAFENDPIPSSFFMDYAVTNTHPQDQENFEEYQQMVEAFASELDDEARLAAWDEFQTYYMENCIYLYPYAQMIDYTLYNTNLKNWNRLLYNNWDFTHAYFE